MSIYVKKGAVTDIDPETGAPRCYIEGEKFPRKVEKLLQMGLLEEREDEPKVEKKKSKIQEA